MLTLTLRLTLTLTLSKPCPQNPQIIFAIFLGILHIQHPDAHFTGGPQIHELCLTSNSRLDEQNLIFRIKSCTEHLILILFHMMFLSFASRAVLTPSRTVMSASNKRIFYFLQDNYRMHISLPIQMWKTKIITFNKFYTLHINRIIKNVTDYITTTT